MPHTTSRREFLQVGAAAMAGSAMLTSAEPAAAQTASHGAQRRNIVFVLIDDLRFDAFGFAGHPFLKTPNLDALAGNGIVFENSFVTTSLCSPSRASILTGTYAHRHGVMDNNTLLPDDLTTFPRLLQQNGYDTAFIGKWHMGGHSDAPQPGFDHWISFKGQGVYKDPEFNVNGESVKRDGYITDLLTDYAEEFLNRSHEKPFLLYLSHKAVHGGFVPADRHKGCYADAKYPHPKSMDDTDDNYRGKPKWVRKQRESWHGVDGMYDKTTNFDTFARDYAETMRGVDDSIGRVVETLRARGLLDSTLILFTSDNGFQFGEHGLIDKRTMYEASIRVPMIAHCPELSKNAQRRKEMVTNVDIAPTLLAAAGVPVPDFVQGESFLKLVRGESSSWRQEFLYEYFWERDFPQTPTVLGIRTNQYKFMKYHGIWDRYELYDIDKDPDEMENLLGAFLQQSEGGTLDALIRRKAEPSIKTLFNEMQEKLIRLLKDTGCRSEPIWATPRA